MHKYDTLKNISRYFSSSLFSNVLGIINAFIKPRLLSPELYGLWNILNIIPLYAAYSHLGSRTSMRYLLPLNIGKHDQHKIAEIKGNVVFGSLYITIIIAVILISVGLIADLSMEVKVGLFTMAAVILLEWYYFTYATILKGYQEFKLLTNAFYLKAGMTFILSISLIYLFSIYGLYLSLIISYTLVNFYLHARFPIGPYSIFNFRQFFQYIKQGLPLLLFGLGTLLLCTSDRMIIALLLGTEQLGFYGISIMVLGFFLSIPDATREVMEPELMKSMSGRSGQENIQQYFLKPLIHMAYFLPFVIGPVIFIVPVLIADLLPEYTNGVLPTQIVIVGGYFLAMSHIARGVIIANNLQMKAIVIIILSITVNITFNIYFIKLGFGIIGVAIGSSISYLFLFLSLLFFIKNKCDHSKALWQETMKAIALPFPIISIVTIPITYALNVWNFNGYIGAFLALFVYTISVYLLLKMATNKYPLLKKVTFNFWF